MSAATTSVFAAGLIDLLPIVIVIVIMIVSALSQLLNKARQAPPAGRPNGPRPAGDLMDEIGDFLRRAQEAAQQAQRPQQPPPPRRPQSAAPVIVAEPVVRAEVVRPQLSSQPLGAAVVAADDALDAQVKQVFDRKLSDAGDLPQPPTSATAAQIEGEGADLAPLLAILADPEGIRNAFILSEVLSRPEHRWA